MPDDSGPNLTQEKLDYRVIARRYTPSRNDRVYPSLFVSACSPRADSRDSPPRGQSKQATTANVSPSTHDGSHRHETANYSTRKTRYPIWVTRRTIEPSASDFNELLSARAASTFSIFNASTRLTLNVARPACIRDMSVNYCKTDLLEIGDT
ncbi:uncharacterized protein LOC143184133 [Calliopsis andreniformis]|uniref:uncharacterized protein LOC143184133 n=1 Tax=Calliopsis andreniformis TaxID=337506 RepID=UPI003FCDE896